MTADERYSLEDVARVAAAWTSRRRPTRPPPSGDLVAPDESDFVADVEQTMVYERVREAVERLPGLQRDVLRLRFGFDGDSPASLQSTAERLGVGVRRVRRAEEEALAALSFDADVLGAHQAA